MMIMDTQNRLFVQSSNNSNNVGRAIASDRSAIVAGISIRAGGRAGPH